MNDGQLLLIVASALIGTGVGSLLYRRSMLAILMSLIQMFYGVILIFTVFSRTSEKNGEVLFLLLCMCVLMMGLYMLGLAQTHRRYKSIGAVDVDEGNELRN